MKVQQAPHRGVGSCCNAQYGHRLTEFQVFFRWPPRFLRDQAVWRVSAGWISAGSSRCC
jgi:hypothetical protein